MSQLTPKPANDDDGGDGGVNSLPFTILQVDHILKLVAEAKPREKPFEAVRRKLRAVEHGALLGRPVDTDTVHDAEKGRDGGVGRGRRIGTSE